MTRTHITHTTRVVLGADVCVNVVSYDHNDRVSLLVYTNTEPALDLALEFGAEHLAIIEELRAALIAKQDAANMRHCSKCGIHIPDDYPRDVTCGACDGQIVRGPAAADKTVA